MHSLLAAEPIARIAVFRALMLGDMLCAVPALRAVRRAFPRATIEWIGLEPTRAMAARLPHLVDGFIALPGYPGLPEVRHDPAALPGFLEEVRGRRFDLALQLHGSGPVVNELVCSFGARRSAGFFVDGALVPARDASLYRRWPDRGHEIERLLSLTDHLGLARDGLALEYPVRAQDREALAALGFERSEADRPYVCLHAGSQLASRRWPAERFAIVGDALAARGRRVVLTGSAGERALVQSVAAAMRRPALDLAGLTTPGMLGALLEGAEALVCNDTSVSHIAAALRCPSVVVSAGADVARWAPLDTARHRVLWQAMPCRPCAHAECPIGHPCALAIEPRAVLRALDEVLAPAPARRRAEEATA
jgi:ADP-heptose:LPS heptosyltransferase